MAQQKACLVSPSESLGTWLKGGALAQHMQGSVSSKKGREGSAW